jgi:hypothetical protein
LDGLDLVRYVGFRFRHSVFQLITALAPLALATFALQQQARA